MNSFRYLIVKYRSLDTTKPMVNIGVVIQSDEGIDCKFSSDLDKIRGIIGDEPIDEFVFKNLEATFKQKFSEGFFTITPKGEGGQRQIKYTDPYYLEYLSNNFLNNYYFNNRGQIEAETIGEGLIRLYQEFIDPSYHEEVTP